MEICLEYEWGIDFEKVIWPLILKNKSIIEIYLIKRPTFFQRVFKQKKHLLISNLGMMDLLPDKTLFDLEIRSFYGGNMDVIYKVGDMEFVLELLKNISSEGNLLKNYNDIPIEKEKVELVEKLVQENEDSLFMTFGHDADVVYFFESKKDPKFINEMLKNESKVKL